MHSFSKWFTISELLNIEGSLRSYIISELILLDSAQYISQKFREIDAFISFICISFIIHTYAYLQITTFLYEPNYNESYLIKTSVKWFHELPFREIRLINWFHKNFAECTILILTYRNQRQMWRNCKLRRWIRWIRVRIFVARKELFQKQVTNSTSSWSSRQSVFQYYNDLVSKNWYWSIQDNYRLWLELEMVWS